MTIAADEKRCHRSSNTGRKLSCNPDGRREFNAQIPPNEKFLVPLFLSSLFHAALRAETKRLSEYHRRDGG